MVKPKPCGCKGCRTCLICESEHGANRKCFTGISKDSSSYVYCTLCNLAWPGWDAEDNEQHPNHQGIPIAYPGVYIQVNFLSRNEEKILMDGIDRAPWDISQSGRRKQNYGPKTNFKKQKLRVGEFKGFPLDTRFVQDKLSTVSLLKDYQTIEQCSLEYDPSRGASIDPHIDDCWVWGERVVTVNCLADSVLTMNKYVGDPTKYNLPLVKTYSPVVPPEQYDNNCDRNIPSDVIVRIPMPRRSLIVLYGPARYEWEHCVLREDIPSRRVCIAYREFTPIYLPGGVKEMEGRQVLERATLFYSDN